MGTEPSQAEPGQVAARRSLLFVPGNKPKMLDKALQRGADVLVLDLEDGVVPPDRAAARREVARRLASGAFAGAECWVRPGSDLDIEALVAAGARPTCVLLPKVDTPEQASRLAETIPWPCVASIEGPRGLLRALEIADACANHGGVGLFFGAADFATDVGCATWPEEDLAGARARVVWAARAAGLQAWDAPHFDIRDDAGNAEMSRLARRLGFHGKATVHPGQLAAVHAAFTPTSEEVVWARRVIAAYDARGITELDGQLVEEPHARAARRLLARADAAGVQEKT